MTTPEKLQHEVVERLIEEIVNRDGPTRYLYANILRYWSKEKRAAFARRLLGEGA